MMKSLAEFVKEKRKEAKLTQEDFAARAGVALTVIRKIEQGKGNLNLEKANQVLKMFGHELAPADSKELSPAIDDLMTQLETLRRLELVNLLQIQTNKQEILTEEKNRISAINSSDSRVQSLKTRISYIEQSITALKMILKNI